jgi:hypothetical protein
MKKTPRIVLDLIHNAWLLPADGKAYPHGAYSSKHLPETSNAIEQVVVAGPAPLGATGIGLWRQLRPTKSRRQPRVEYVEGSIE